MKVRDNRYSKKRKSIVYCEEFSSDSLSMWIDNQLFYVRVGINNTNLYFLKKEKTKKTLNVSQDNKSFYATHAKVLSGLILVLFYLLVANLYLLSLIININSSITVAKSFNSYITLCNQIITICISITTSILANQVLLKTGDIEMNSRPKKSSAIKCSVIAT